MATPIYKLVLYRPTDAWFKMSEKETTEMQAKLLEALKSVGGQRVVMCNSGWSSEQWFGFTVEKYPDIEAVQKYAKALLDLGWFGLAEAMSILGVESPQG